MSYANSLTTNQQTAFVATKSTAKKIMNVALWILQILWGVFYCFTGFGKLMCYRQDVWNFTLHQPVAWFHAVPEWLFVFIGVSEFLGGAGLILPAMTRVKPKLTTYAAIGLTLIMILAAIFHIARGEFGFFVPMNLVLGGVTAFIAYGRLKTSPVAPSSPSIFRIIAGVVVLGGLTFAGFAPIWYQVMHAQ
jgi:uncharacterized membrane protein YphA (DoxX/SURF4 family)